MQRAGETAVSLNGCCRVRCFNAIQPCGLAARSSDSVTRRRGNRKGRKSANDDWNNTADAKITLFRDGGLEEEAVSELSVFLSTGGIEIKKERVRVKEREREREESKGARNFIYYSGEQGREPLPFCSRGIKKGGRREEKSEGKTKEEVYIWGTKVYIIIVHINIGIIETRGCAPHPRLLVRTSWPARFLPLPLPRRHDPRYDQS